MPQTYLDSSSSRSLRHQTIVSPTSVPSRFDSLSDSSACLSEERNEEKRTQHKEHANCSRYGKESVPEVVPPASNNSNVEPAAYVQKHQIQKRPRSSESLPLSMDEADNFLRCMGIAHAQRRPLPRSRRKGPSIQAISKRRKHHIIAERNRRYSCFLKNSTVTNADNEIPTELLTN